MERNNSSRFVRECGDKKWSKGRRLVVLVGMLVVLVIAPVTAVPRQMMIFKPWSNDGEICQTDDCSKAEKRIIQGMDKTVTPCQDFYNFTCSRVFWRYRISPSKGEWSQFEILRQEYLRDLRLLLVQPEEDNDLRPLKLAKALYKMCMDTESDDEELELTPIFEMFSELGLSRDLLLFNNPKIDTEINLDLSKIAGIAVRYLDVNLFVKFSITDCDSDLNKSCVEIQQISPGFSERYLSDPKRFKSKLMEYKLYIKKMVELAGVTSEDSASFADEILNFSTKIAKIMVGPEKSVDASLVDVSELPTLTEASALRWNWAEYLEAVFENTSVVLKTHVRRVSVKHMEYLQKLRPLLSTTPRFTIARFIWWSVYSTVAPKIFGKCSELQWKLNVKWQSSVELDNLRAETCVNLANSHFKLVLADVYTKKYSHHPLRTDEDEQNHREVKKMFPALKEAFDEILSELQWLDAGLRAELRKKLNAMKLIVGYPEWITDHEKLDKFYEEAEVIPGKKNETFLRLTDVDVKWKLNRLGGKSRGNDSLQFENYWSLMCSSESNSIIIPETFLQHPFYSNGIESLNYGVLGMLMAHKMVHGFDTRGKFLGLRYDENSKNVNWWNSPEKKARETFECIIKHYSSYHQPELGKNIKVDGVRTLKENLADNIGIRVAYRAYQKLKSKGLKKQVLHNLSDYTQDQLFFLGFAQTWCGMYTNERLQEQHLHDTHSPYRVRVSGTLSNNKEFSKAWNCPIGSPMNPSRKCVI